MPKQPRLTDAEAYALFLLDTVHCTWREGSVNTVVPGELGGSFGRLELPEIKRRLAALSRRGLVETPTGYKRGEAYRLLPALEEAWDDWMRNRDGFNKIEEFKSRG